MCVCGVGRGGGGGGVVDSSFIGSVDQNEAIDFIFDN